MTLAVQPVEAIAPQMRGKATDLPAPIGALAALEALLDASEDQET